MPQIKFFSSVMLFVILVFSSCGISKITPSNVQKVDVIYSNVGLNYGDSAKFQLLASKKSGEKVDVTNHRQLEIIAGRIDFNRETGWLFIHPKPTQPNIKELEFTIKITDKEDIYQQNGTIQLSFEKGVYADARGEKGQGATAESNRLTRVLLRDGKTGRNGEDGLDGGNAENATVHIWLNDGMYFIRVFRSSTSEIFWYQTTNGNNIIVDASGGAAGDGGDGGDGGRGRKGDKKKDLAPGKGGDGGNGGNGGNGGDGAELLVFLHPTAKDIVDNISLLSNGGRAGRGGAAGAGGEGGRPDSGQEKAASGEAGIPGENGIAGKPGKINMTIQEFDFSQF
jgi:hypothetical protein